MNGNFTLPGAHKLTSFLVFAAGSKKLIAIESRVVGRPKYRKWIIKLDSQYLGEYFIYYPGPGEKKCIKTFTGLIPGYINESIVIWNKENTNDLLPINRAMLIYSNIDMKKSLKSATAIKESWKRQDEHKEIPFP